jgi:spore germination protein KC
MKARIIAFFMNIIMMFILVGCWDASEINDYSLVSLAGVDKVDDKVRLFLEETTSSSGSSDSQSGTGNKTKILVSEGSSFTEARNSYLRRGEKGLFTGSLRAIVFSDNYSKGGVEEYFNRIRGLRESSKIIKIFTTNTEFDKLLDTSQTGETIIANNIEHLSEELAGKGMLNNVIMADQMENVLVKNTGYLMNNIDKVNGTIEIDGYSVFKDNKEVGLIPAREMRGVNYFIVNKSYSEYTVDFEGAKAALSAQVKNKKIKAHYDGKNIDFRIQMFLHCEIIDLSKMVKLNNEKMKKLQNEISEVIKQDMLNTIKTSQVKYECDYLQFYKSFRERYNYDFKNMNWNNKYKQAKFNVEVRVDVEPANLVNLG